MINIILLLLLIITVLVLSIIIVPIKYTLVYTYEEKVRYSFTLCSGFLLKSNYEKLQDEKLEMQTRIMGIPLPLKKSPKDVPVQKEKKKSNRHGSRISLIRVFLEKRLHISLWELFKKLLRMFSPNSIIIRGRYGFYEPEYTALLLSASSFLNSLKEEYTIHLEPVWDDEYLGLYAHIVGSVVPALLLFHLLKFILQGSTLHFLAEMRKNKKAHHKAAVQPL